MANRNDDDVTRTHIVLGKGTAVNHYLITEKIGAGGMGEVYLADDTKLNRQVALKFLPGHMAQNQEVRARFTREAQAVAKLDHPNIVTIYEVGEFNNRPFFAMQYISGKTLSSYSTENQLPITRIVGIALQIAEGLSRAHTSGVSHRDIKSANIIVDKEFRPKILDFGLASIQGSEMLTKAGSTLGTVAYMSPEQAQGGEIDYRSDLFSLGIVLYEMIAGRTPFKRNNDAATLHAIVSEAPEPLVRFKAEVTPELQRIVTKSLTKNPDERYQSAADLAADLRSVERMLAAGASGSSMKVATLQPSIAVLPFTNMSADPENEYFSDGLTEELLNMLAKNPALKVTGRTSSFAFKGKQEDLRTIGQKLGVQTLLEGSVRRAGARVRITAQLVNTADGFHLWSETYDRVLDDIFAVQDEIAGAVSKAMHVTLVGVSETKKAINPESYTLSLRAHQLVLQMTKEGLAVAVDLYKRAIDIDANNAAAWAGLGYAYGSRVAYGHTDYKVEHPLARAAAEKALALDDQSPEAHQTMCFVLGALELRIPEGLKEIRRAYELAPNSSAVVSGMATWELIFGNFDKAIKLATRGIELDPLNPWNRRELARMYACCDRWEDAREALLRAFEMSPEMTTLNFGLGLCAISTGKPEEAMEYLAKEKMAGYRLCGQAQASFMLGRKEDSDHQKAELIAQGEQWSFQIAMVCACRNEIDDAFEWLERGYAIRDSGMALTKVTRVFRPLHSDPRWPVLLKKIGLVD
ncbi:MAG: protein kinase [Candidatus Zixiibacteriota bacterium]